LNNIFVGVPAILGSNGLERVIEVELDENEKEMFSRSVASVRATLQTLSEMGF